MMSQKAPQTLSSTIENPFVFPTQITVHDIEQGLRKLGLNPGDAVEVHSSLSRLGTVEGGASVAIQALMNVVGSQGAIIMSAYPVGQPLPLTQEEKQRGLTWKCLRLSPDSDEKTGMGAIADSFRRRADVVCGTGLHRVAAWGRDARRHSKGYEHLLAVDGWALLIGVGIDRCSSLHLGEKAGIPEEIRRRFRVPEDITRDYPADVWVIGYGRTPDDAWGKVWQEALRRGLINSHHIGPAECNLFKAKAVVGIYEEFLRTDPYALFGVDKDGR